MKKENWNIEGQLDVFDILKETEVIQKPEKPPETFEDYIGRCEYCYWYGYGLYSNFTHKRKEGTEGFNCQWEMMNRGPFNCIGKNKWMPSVNDIPRLCGNCIEGNCFHYQTKPEHKPGTIAAFRDPVDEPNIYCLRDEGSVNRSQPYKDFYETGFGACLWDRQHEWDTCDAWVRDAGILQDNPT